MVTRKTMGAVVGGLGLVLSITLTGAAAMGAPRVTGPTAVAPPPGPLAAADQAASTAVIADRPDTIPEL
ncbi:MAG: hypothetical protein E6K82_15335 [Candidatus Rokuibacteriota bacterium]|nr:MAG: hypothetical protein E6K82_15335 [Candidatus Rokubacteria bacterium]